MRRPSLLTALIAAVIATISVASHAGPTCRVESDVVESYHHMLARAVGPWLTGAEPSEFLRRNDWVPAWTADVCNFMETGRRDIDLVADAPAASGGEMQEGRAVEEIR